jgi:GT2 family glycosyltransferase
MLASLIIPTHNRHDELRATLARVAALDADALERAGGAEIIVADNRSTPRVKLPTQLENGVRVSCVHLDHNRGAAARNDAAALARGRWLVMLDDDSAPTDAGFLAALADAANDVAAIGADIWLPPSSSDGLPRRESGGLPEVPVGCGVAYRRSAYLSAGGYDAGFVFYGEEYDLAARLIAGGHRIVHDHRFRVLHRKAATNRDFASIVGRLVRNNTAVWQRYAPDQCLSAFIDRELRRLATIADREGVRDALEQSVHRLDEHLAIQPRTPLSVPHFERLIGLAAARDGLRSAHRELPIECALLALPPGPPGKHAQEIERALGEIGVRCVRTERDMRQAGPTSASHAPQAPSGRTVIIPATLAPGPMLDAAGALQRMGAAGLRDPAIVLPWDPRAMSSSSIAGTATPATSASLHARHALRSAS